MKVLCLIPARGGSKGVPGKNLRQLQGLSLIGFKAISARRSRYCDRLIISTDDEEIRSEGLRHTAEAPFIRPARFATDEATSNDVISHAMQWIEENTSERYDAVMLLQPAAPFATYADLNATVEMMIERNAAAVVSMRRVRDSAFYSTPLDADGSLRTLVSRIRDTKPLRRQDQPAQFVANGAIYLFRWDMFTEHRAIFAEPDRTFAYVMDDFHSVDIDDPVDLAWAGFLLQNGYVDWAWWT